jgi:hypothetical protein
MKKLPDALEILADSECGLGIKAIGFRGSKYPLEFKVARYQSEYLVGPAHDDQAIFCFYPNPNIRHLDMRHNHLKTYFRADGLLKLTLLNTEQEVTIPPEPSFVFYHHAEDMPKAEYVIVSNEDYIKKCHEKQRFRAKKKS